MGIALASGYPAASGWIGAMVGGIVIGLLSGVPLQVSGPSVGLIFVMVSLFPEFGWEALCLITVCAGVVQSVLGIFKLADGVLAISPGVNYGLLAGLGLLAAKNQLIDLVEESSGLAITLCLATVAISFLGQRWGWKKLPGPMLALVVTTFASMVLPMDIPHLQMGGSLGGVDIHLPLDINLTSWVVPVLTLTLIASNESLLCAGALRKMLPGAKLDLDRELSAQGVGNVVSGLLGGLPVCGLVLHSKANIRAGALSRWSVVIHGVWILGFAVCCYPILERIPLASLSGLVIYMGLNLVMESSLRPTLLFADRLIYAITFLAVCVFGLTWGVGLGVFVAVLAKMRLLGKAKVEVEMEGNYWGLRIVGSFTFTTIPELNEALSKIPVGQPVKLDLALEYIDRPAFDRLRSWREHHEALGGRVILDDLHQLWFSSVYQTPRDQPIPCCF